MFGADLSRLRLRSRFTHHYCAQYSIGSAILIDALNALILGTLIVCSIMILPLFSSVFLHYISARIRSNTLLATSFVISYLSFGHFFISRVVAQLLARNLLGPRGAVGIVEKFQPSRVGTGYRWFYIAGIEVRVGMFGSGRECNSGNPLQFQIRNV